MSAEMTTFDPHSNDAMFAKVLAKLEEHSAVLKEIKDQGEHSERKIASLENWRSELTGRMAVIALLVSFGATLVIQLILAGLK
jgi:hypothetical protein